MPMSRTVQRWSLWGTVFGAVLGLGPGLLLLLMAAGGNTPVIRDGEVFTIIGERSDYLLTPQ